MIIIFFFEKRKKRRVAVLFLEKLGMADSEALFCFFPFRGLLTNHFKEEGRCRNTAKDAWERLKVEDSIVEGAAKSPNTY